MFRIASWLFVSFSLSGTPLTLAGPASAHQGTTSHPACVFIPVIPYSLAMAPLLPPHVRGIEYLRQPSGESLTVASYFECVDNVRPLLAHDEFAGATPGLYFNFITVPNGAGNCLRLTYFSTAPATSQTALQRLVSAASSGLSLYETEWTLRPIAASLPEALEREDLALRTFLALNSTIVLDVLQRFGVEPLRALVHNYRHTQLPQRLPPERAMAAVFSANSQTYASLTAADQADYWRSLTHLFLGRDFALHFLVNMLAVEEAAYDRRWFDPAWIER